MSVVKSTRIQLVCETCGGGFSVKRYRFAQTHNPRFCCRMCYLRMCYLRRELIPTTTCEVCGKKYARLYKVGRFCSRKCFYDKRRVPLEDRFWNSVGKKTETGCILWTGSVISRSVNCDYGVIQARRWRGRRKLAHRVAYELMVGPIPDGLHVLHRCDNPRCINPVHLFLGTQADNNADKDAKGRHRAPKGEDHPRAILTDEGVRDIRRRAATTSYEALATEHGVRTITIRAVVSRRSWKHIE